jgi:pyrophosphatase PpaX
MIKAVIFDFDMTLVNSLRQKIELMRIFCRGDRKYLQKMHGDLKTFFGLSFKELAKEYSTYQFTTAKKMYLKAFRATAHLVKFNGRKAMIELRRKGYKTAILSNEHRENIQIVLRNERIKTDLLLSTIKMRKTKPNPMPLHIAMKKLHTKPKEVIYIGDHPKDIMMGRRAGVVTVGLANVLHGRRALERYKPHYIITNVNEIARVAERINYQ